jgi:hypothetical protein
VQEKKAVRMEEEARVRAERLAARGEEEDSGGGDGMLGDYQQDDDVVF